MNNQTKAKQLAYIALSTALIAVGGFIKIPLPFGVSMTLQVFFVVLSGFLIGELAAFSALAYLVIGLVGVPIFTKGGGFYYVFEPTFGYIISFVLAGFIAGRFTKGKSTSFLRYVAVGVICVLAVYFIGISYFSLIFELYLGNKVTASLIFKGLFLSFAWKDLLLVVFAAYLAERVKRYY